MSFPLSIPLYLRLHSNEMEGGRYMISRCAWLTLVTYCYPGEKASPVELERGQAGGLDLALEDGRLPIGGLWLSGLRGILPACFILSRRRLDLEDAFNSTQLGTTCRRCRSNAARQVRLGGQDRHNPLSIPAEPQGWCNPPSVSSSHRRNKALHYIHTRRRRRNMCGPLSGLIHMPTKRARALQWEFIAYFSSRALYAIVYVCTSYPRTRVGFALRCCSGRGCIVLYSALMYLDAFLSELAKSHRRAQKVLPCREAQTCAPK